MAEEFFNSITNALIRLGGLLYVISFGLLTASFITAVIVSLTVNEFGIKKRLAFLGAPAVIFSFLITLLSVGAIKVQFVLIAVTVTVGYAFVLALIPKKQKKITEEQRNLLRFIDEKIKERERDEPEELPAQTVVQPTLDTEREEVVQDSLLDVNFSHVRNVIARLNYFGLSTSDRRQISELECALLQAERGDKDAEIKEKINDGLSSLLKIMSKYGA